MAAISYVICMREKPKPLGHINMEVNTMQQQDLAQTDLHFKVTATSVRQYGYHYRESGVCNHFHQQTSLPLYCIHCILF